MTAQDVETAIIRPMLAALPAPTHVRNDPAAREELLNVYRRALERFDRPTLERAWQKAASGQKYWTWPLPEVIAGAAEHFHALAHPKSKPDDDWVEKATALADAYTRRYMTTTQAAVRAREQGYERELRAYVTETSWVQGQMILGREHIGYVSGVLFPGRERDKEAEGEFFEKCRAQADSGSIKVSLPRGLLEGWRRDAAAQTRSR